MDPLRFLRFPCCARLRKARCQGRGWNDTVLKYIFVEWGIGAHRGSELAFVLGFGKINVG